MAELETTFVPQKPIIEEAMAPGARRPVFGFINFVATAIFLAALVAAALVYFYKVTLDRQVVLMGKQLQIARGAFEPSLITEMQQLDKKFVGASAVLKDHLNLSPLFVELEQNTLKQVQFTEFNYSFKDGKIIVKMSGKARDYRTIALQNDLLSANRYFKSILFSNMALDEAGRVAFELNFNIDPDFLRASRKI